MRRGKRNSEIKDRNGKRWRGENVKENVEWKEKRDSEVKERCEESWGREDVRGNETSNPRISYGQRYPCPAFHF